jgi:hypothetical protein
VPENLIVKDRKGDSDNTEVLDIWKVRDERESVMISFKLRLEDQGEL